MWKVNHLNQKPSYTCSAVTGPLSILAVFSQNYRLRLITVTPKSDCKLLFDKAFLLKFVININSTRIYIYIIFAKVFHIREETILRENWDFQE